ncbi:DinB family protein [Chloroflexota bacterium]
MQPDFKLWNQQQKELRSLLDSVADHDQGIALFLAQHAMLHIESVSPAATGSFADALWQDLTAEQARYIPPNGEHSIVWCLWHIARIEDVTMNMLVAGRAQVWQDEDWAARLQTTRTDTANVMDRTAVVDLTASLDLDALREYRAAVGWRTRENVQVLQPGDLTQKVDSDRIAQVRASGVVVAEAQVIVDYWSKRTLATLLLMPPTRHNMVHLNEAALLKKRKRR